MLLEEGLIIESEPINYTNCVLKEQGFLFLERTGEPSLDAITVPDVPESRDYFVNTSVASTGSAGNTSNNFGCTRGQLYFEPGILGFVEVKYVAVLIFTAIPDLGASFTISQL